MHIVVFGFVDFTEWYGQLAPAVTKTKKNSTTMHSDCLSFASEARAERDKSRTIKIMLFGVTTSDGD